MLRCTFVAGAVFSFPLAPGLQFGEATRRTDCAVGESCKILIAERNRHVRELLRRELLAEGYTVEVAKDGHEVWLMINRGNPPSLIILDLEIPYLDDLVERAHFREGEPTVPLIIFSFLPEEDDRNLPRAAAFLEKKEDTDRLKEVVAEVIGRYYPDKPHQTLQGKEPKKGRI